MTEENILGEKMKYYVWGIVEAYTGTNDIYFGQLTRKAAGDYDGDLNVTGIWWGIPMSSANTAEKQEQRRLSLA